MSGSFGDSCLGGYGRNFSPPTVPSTPTTAPDTPGHYINVAAFWRIEEYNI